MGMFDYVYTDDPSDILSTRPNEARYQSKDGPCTLGMFHRDAVNDDGSWMFNTYHDDDVRFKRGPNGWIKIGDG